MKMKTLLMDLAPAVPSEAVVLRSLAVTLVAMPYSQGDSPPWSQAGFRTSWPCTPLPQASSPWECLFQRTKQSCLGVAWLWFEPSPNQWLWPGD